MFKSVFAALGVALAFMITPVAANAAEGEAATGMAKIVFYRAEETSRTRKVNFEAYAGGKPVGRLQYRKPVVVEVPAGDLQLTTSLPGSDKMNVQLAEGQTYYVYSSLERKGQKFVASMELVEEQVALSQSPALDGVI